MEISEKLKLLRKERGMTQSEVGEKIGQERSTIACYETGKRTPDIATLERLARLYKVTLDYFSEKNETDIIIELLSRSNAFFNSINISDEDKDKVHRDIMSIYLRAKELKAINEQQDNTSDTEKKVRKNKTN